LVCGLTQIASAATVIPSGGAGISPLAALGCWAAAATLVPLATRKRAPASSEPLSEAVVVDSGGSDVTRLADIDMDVRKNQFLAMLGHELRNPLAPIRNAVKIMKLRGSDDPDLCWARDVVDHQVRQMSQLVDELLDMARVAGGKVRLQKEPVDVATIVAYAVETSRPVIEQQHHRFSIAFNGDAVYVLADAIRMAQVLSNLLNNAAKYTNPGGNIRLIVAVEGAQVVFRVKDSGIGIPPELVARVFDLFMQVDHSLDHSQGGLGLGLTLVRSLVEMHGGTAEARSDGLNRGSEFIVRLPILDRSAVPAALPQPADQPPTTPPNPLPASRPLPTRRVLVVDDNVASAQSLAMVLKLENYDVQVAHDGSVVAEKVRAFRPEAVLMDIGLPGIDGYQVARQLRGRANPDVHVALLVAMTGYAEDEARVRSREAGFDHHFVKPMDPDALLALLASMEWSEDVNAGELCCDRPASPISGSLPASLPRSAP
jgi:signal transduction histidine kinase/ActR/RegA family two-component response regulator